MSVRSLGGVRRRLVLLSALAVAGGALAYSFAPGGTARPAPVSPAKLAAAIVGGSGAQATAHDPIFMQVAGIPGQSTDPTHTNWISLTSWGWGVHNSHPATTGPTFDPVVITMLINRAVPPILTALAKATVIPAVSTQFTITSGSTETVYLDVELSGVQFTNAVSQSVGSYPAETFDMTYTRISYTYNYVSGGTTTKYKFCWDLVKKLSC
jgi:type VI secretion system secreted protein Hcp